MDYVRMMIQYVVRVYALDLMLYTQNSSLLLNLPVFTISLPCLSIRSTIVSVVVPVLGEKQSVEYCNARTVHYFILVCAFLHLVRMHCAYIWSYKTLLYTAYCIVQRVKFNIGDRIEDRMSRLLETA